MTLVIIALFFIALGFAIGIFFMGAYINKYFAQNPYKIRWKGKTYVLTDKPDTNGDNITPCV